LSGDYESSIVQHLKKHLSEGASSAPLYVQLTEAIQTEIINGVLPEGAHLPSERGLSDALGISRVTVRKSFTELVDRGALIKRQGARTVVQRKLQKPMSKLNGFSETLASRGMKSELRWINKAVSKPTAQEVVALGIRPDEKVNRYSRVRIADGEPIAIEVAAVPAQHLPTLELDCDSLYATLERFENRPVRGVQRVTASLMTAREAQYLKGVAGAPVLVFERTCYLSDGRAVEYTRSRYNGALFDFVSEIE
jgi:GntR family transcriptional regulator